MLSSAPILVTGATGFVGSAVARALAAHGQSMRLLVRAGSDLSNVANLEAERVEGDLRDPASLDQAAKGCAGLFHLAADYRLWVPDPARMMAANVDGTVALMRAAQRAGVARIVYCSSVAALGQIGDGTPANEDTPNDPAKIVGAYKQSKYRAEQAVRAMVRNESLPAVIVNPSTPVGPCDIKPTPTGKTIRDAADGKIPAYIDTGLNIVHVDDVAAGHLLAYQHGRIGESYILGGEDFLLRDLLGLIAEVAGRKPPTLALPPKALWPVAIGCEWTARAFGTDPLVTREMLLMAKKKMFFSSAKGRAELGYAPRPARLAIEDAVAWFRANGKIAA